MHAFARFVGRNALVLGVLALAAGPVGAQNTPYYPYWGTAPSSYYGTPIRSMERGPFPLPSLGPVYASPLFGPGYSLEGRLGVGGFGAFPASSSFLSDADILLPGSTYTPRPDNRAHLWLQVPAEARVWFDGERTRQGGALRHYFTPPLTPGKNYTYQVQARWTQDGKTVERKERIAVHAGQSLRVNLAQPPAPPHDEKKGS
jgi:uncharacterized protein (TIGR03000 family)